MAWKAVLTLAVLLTAGISGCIGNDDAEGDDRLEPTGVGAATSLVETAMPIEWHGAIGGYVYACTMVTCVGQGLPGEWDNFLELDTDPLPTAVELTVTWDDPLPVLNELAVGISADRCENGPCDMVAWVAGPSPLTLSEPALDLEEGDAFNLVVWRPWQGTPVAGGGGGLPVEFHVEGTYTVMGPAGPA